MPVGLCSLSRGHCGMRLTSAASSIWTASTTSAAPGPAICGRTASFSPAEVVFVDKLGAKLGSDLAQPVALLGQQHQIPAILCRLAPTVRPTTLQALV